MRRTLATLLASGLLALFLLPLCLAGVNRIIQQEYKTRFENQTVFLCVPAFGNRQRITLREGGYRLEPETDPLRFKVGEQVRILEISFHSDEIRFKLGSVDAARQSELSFRFPAELDDAFSQRKHFDTVIKQVFAEGQNYSDIDRSKRDFIRHQLDAVVGEFMSSTAVNREFVLDALADSLPAYQKAVDENRSLKDKNQELTAKLSTEQSKSKQLESKVVEQTSELNRIKSMNQSLKTDLDAMSTSSAGASRELQQLKQQATEIQGSAKRLQRGLGVELDAAKTLSKQVEDLMVAALKTKGDRDALDIKLKAADGELGKTRDALQTQIKTNADLKKENLQLQDNVKLLSSRGDQLGQRYLALQKQKNQLESFVRAVEKLKALLVRETEEGDRCRRVLELRLNNALIGTLEVDYPATAKMGEKTELRVKFTAESIDYVKLTDEEKKILGTLGEKLTVRNELQDLPGGMTAVLRESAEQKGKTASGAALEIAERSSGEWVWSVETSRVGSLNPQLLTFIINQNKDAVPLIQSRLRIESQNLAQQIGRFLSPIPLGLGILFGLVIFAAVRALRR